MQRKPLLRRKMKPNFQSWSHLPVPHPKNEIKNSMKKHILAPPKPLNPTSMRGKNPYNLPRNKPHLWLPVLNCPLKSQIQMLFFPPLSTYVIRHLASFSKTIKGGSGKSIHKLKPLHQAPCSKSMKLSSQRWKYLTFTLLPNQSSPRLPYF